MTPIHYPTILFDWGDTVMKDDPTSNVPMVEWQTIEIVPGIESVLAYLQSSGRRIVLATSASISNESQIWDSFEMEALVASTMRRPLDWRYASTDSIPGTISIVCHSTMGTLEVGSSFITVSPQSKRIVG